jgi:hypothetical protein
LDIRDSTWQRDKETEEMRGFSKYSLATNSRISWEGHVTRMKNTGKESVKFNRKQKKKESFLKLWRREDDDIKIYWEEIVYKVYTRFL